MKIGLLNGASLGLMTFVILGFYIHFSKVCMDVRIPYIRLCGNITCGCDGNIKSCGNHNSYVFHKVHIDPAVASGPLITTINDLVAVVTYYGLARLLLINIFHI